MSCSRTRSSPDCIRVTAGRGCLPDSWRWCRCCSSRRTCPTARLADAVRTRIDWKYALSLELEGPGFDHSVLCEFRARLAEPEGAADRLLQVMLDEPADRAVWAKRYGCRRSANCRAGRRP
ncbi:transposase [Streptomyces sp. NPDC001292]|uniref:transposase n=1 Tax=Streptomyces sp. NPDC001292 TaxID=3364558 RepID=UPI0036ADEBE9